MIITAKLVTYNSQKHDGTIGSGLDGTLFLTWIIESMVHAWGLSHHCAGV